jgi:predicted lipoprotein with Yx(FWY)xxD motif
LVFDFRNGEKMRLLRFSLVFMLLVSQAQSANAPKKTSAKDLPYPAEVSVVTLDSGWTYRQSANGLPLYFSDKDGAGKSMCNEGCDTQWIPLQAPEKSKSLGRWSVIARKDHRRQWAYLRRPVYLRIHDSAEMPTGDGVDGTWHLLPIYR